MAFIYEIFCVIILLSSLLTAADNPSSIEPLLVFEQDARVLSKVKPISGIDPRSETLWSFLYNTKTPIESTKKMRKKFVLRKFAGNKSLKMLKFIDTLEKEANALKDKWDAANAVYIYKQLSLEQDKFKKLVDEWITLIQGLQNKSIRCENLFSELRKKICFNEMPGVTKEQVEKEQKDLASKIMQARTQLSQLNEFFKDFDQDAQKAVAVLKDFVEDSQWASIQELTNLKQNLHVLLSENGFILKQLNPDLWQHFFEKKQNKTILNDQKVKDIAQEIDAVETSAKRQLEKILDELENNFPDPKQKKKFNQAIDAQKLLELVKEGQVLQAKLFEGRVLPLSVELEKLKGRASNVLMMLPMLLQNVKKEPASQPLTEPVSAPAPAEILPSSPQPEIPPQAQPSSPVGSSEQDLLDEASKKRLAALAKLSDKPRLEAPKEMAQRWREVVNSIGDSATFGAEVRQAIEGDKRYPEILDSYSEWRDNLSKDFAKDKAQLTTPLTDQVQEIIDALSTAIINHKPPSLRRKFDSSVRPLTETK